MVMNLVRYVNTIVKRKKVFDRNIVTVVHEEKSKQSMSKMHQIYASEYRFEMYDKADCRGFLREYYDNNHLFKYNSLSTDEAKEFFFACAYIYERGGAYISTHVVLKQQLKEVFQHRNRCYLVQGNTNRSIYAGVMCSPAKNPIFKMMLNEMCKTDSKQFPEVFSMTNSSLYQIVDRLTDCPLITNWNPLWGYPDMFLLKLHGDIIKNFEGDLWFNVLHTQNANEPIPNSKNTEEVIEIASCSKFGQDGWVLNSCNFKTKGYYVDIGSANGITANNTYIMDNTFKWKGLCIDPLATNMKTRTASVHKGVAYHSDEEVCFVYAQDRSGIEGCGEIKKGEKIYKQARGTEAILLEHDVPSVVDYLSVSVEGSELAVLQGIDFKTRKFNYITVNDGNDQEFRYRIGCFLQSKGYRLDMPFPEGAGFVSND